MTGRIGAFVIHLSRATQRKSQVERIKAACPLAVIVIDAVDGSRLSDSEISAVHVPAGLYDPPYPFDISKGEIGCFLSHRKAWQAILDGGFDAGLVIEDDVEIEPATFGPALAAAIAELGRAGFVQFQVRPIRNPGPVVASAGEIVFRRPVIVPLRASCTLYSADAARHLRARTECFDRPVDGYLQLHWESGLRPWLVEPSGVTDRGSATGGTTIQARNVPFGRRLRREILRPLYRWRIRSLSNRAEATNPAR